LIALVFDLLQGKGKLESDLKEPQCIYRTKYFIGFGFRLQFIRRVMQMGQGSQ
jgi:hypothetical protein